MSIFNALYNAIIAPIEFIIESVFVFYNLKIGLFGLAGAILAVSLAVNFLALPIYNIADNLQQKERDTQKRLSNGVKRIKSAFSGDERFMILQCYYKQNHYHPLYALRASLSILIEIPFFIAAYHFLSHSESLSQASFLFIDDLGKADQLIQLPIKINGGRLNALPIIMTLINFISAAVYLKKSSFREKTQTYALALVFLVLLYNSPSGLVLYWILNNLFSLAKNVINAKAKNPKKIVHAIISGIFLAVAIYFLLATNYSFAKRAAILVLALAITLAPPLIKNAPRRFIPSFDLGSGKEEFRTFLFSSIGLALLAGLYIPSSIIKTSPLEFSYIGKMESPLHFIFCAAAFFAGLFLFWPLALYKMSSQKTRKFFLALFLILFAAALLNVFAFKYDYGNFNVFFQLDNSSCLRNFSLFYSILPFAAVAALAIIFFALAAKYKALKYGTQLILILCAAELFLGAKNALQIQKEFNAYKGIRSQSLEKEQADSDDNIEPVYKLSPDKKNVVVLFLDRAIGALLPYILQEFPDMKEQYSGFVFYPNTVSYSGYTAKAFPAMTGGYEYTPPNANKRECVSLKQKHNEATLLMPRLFMDAGFDVTVTDPAYPNYTLKGDLSAFKDYPKIKACEIFGTLNKRYKKNFDNFTDNSDIVARNNLESFVLLEILPPILRNAYYKSGRYYRSEQIPELLASGFLSSWTCLYYLPELTSFDGKNGSFIFIDNETTHEYAQLENKTYLPTLNPNPNSISCGKYNFSVPPNSDRESDAKAYHVNASALIQVGKWLDFLKKNNCYDNTRIIIVSDHGRDIPLPQFNGMKYGLEYAYFNPLFMAKDFGARGQLKTDDSFMTNADTLFLAKKDLPISSANPFTGNNVEDFVDKSLVEIYQIVQRENFSEMTPPSLKDRTQWILQGKKISAKRYTVHDSIFDEANWTRE